MSSAELEKLAAEVADDQKAIEGDNEDTRKRVIRMGKKLAKMQKAQKKEQAETGQTWKDWCEEQKAARPLFPNDRDVRKYTLIAKYPGAYDKGMSIKEAYKQAGRWKANGGNPPDPVKVSIKQRLLITLQVAAGKLGKKLDALVDAPNLAELATEQEWTEDEILGAIDELTLVRQSCNAGLKVLRECHERV